MRCIDYTDQKIGHLTVKLRVADKEYISSRQVQWLCECECGKQVLMVSTRLRRKEPSLSCGCKNFTGEHKNSKHSATEASFLGLFNRNKQSARKRGIDWDLSLAEFISIVTQPCVWCKEPPFTPYNSSLANNGYTQLKHLTPRLVGGKILVNGIDRIDNSKGYTLENVQPSCKYCNFARNDRTQNEFLTWLTKLARIYTGGVNEGGVHVRHS